MKFDFSVVQNTTLGNNIRTTAHFDYGSTGERLLSKFITRPVPEKRIYFDFRVNYLHNREWPFN